MLIHPWDAAISDTEWRDWLAGHDFGQLAVSDPDGGAPHVIPTHFAVDGYTLLVHLEELASAEDLVDAVKIEHLGTQATCGPVG